MQIFGLHEIVHVMFSVGGYMAILILVYVVAFITVFGVSLRPTCSWNCGGGRWRSLLSRSLSRSAAAVCDLVLCLWLPHHSEVTRYLTVCAVRFKLSYTYVQCTKCICTSTCTCHGDICCNLLHVHLEIVGDNYFLWLNKCKQL